MATPIVKNKPEANNAAMPSRPMPPNYLALAEARARTVPQAEGHAPRPVRHVGVVGGGTMGAGIAVALLQAGLTMTLVERDDAALQAGGQRIRTVFDGMVTKGRLTAEEAGQMLGRLRPSTALADLAPVDLAIEAVYEDMAVKLGVLAELDRHCRPGAILATNTSYLDVNAMAEAISRPADVIGLHFFSPAHVMRLLEVVLTDHVAPDVVATALDLAQRLRKVAVCARVCDGFIGNRILAVYRAAADHMVEDGASPYEIDAMARAFGFPMGPYEVSDLAGGDIGWATRKRRAATRDPRARYVAIADRLCENGWFGQKTGRGWYRYAPGSRQGTPCPDVMAIIEAERGKAGITPRRFTEAEMQTRYLCAMVNEGLRVVGEGIALQPSDVDVVMAHGYGFPKDKGGPMAWADTQGLETVLAHIGRLHDETRARDPLFWQPAPLLTQLVAEGRTWI
jgi:3-hydroxyacyl-CoA dehydrogenase